MKQLYYSFRTILRSKGANLIKIISLTLGLFIGILLFARIAYDMNYNSSYTEPDKLCAIMAQYKISGFSDTPLQVVFGPVPAALLEAFPDEIESATVTQNRGNNQFYFGDKQYEFHMMLGDSLFFQTIGIRVLKGNITDMSFHDALFISESMAKKIFGTEEPIGKVLRMGESQDVTVRGVYADIPENSSVRPEAVLSFATHRYYNWGFFGWNGGDSYQGYVRLKNAKDIDKVNPAIKAVIDNYMPLDFERDGWEVKYQLKNLRKAYIEESGVMKRIIMMGFLGIVILLIAAFNYVLISISSLLRRAKAIGVHKCNGATNTNVFSMFMWETAILILISLILVITLFLNLKGYVEYLIQTSLGGLFTIHTLWLPALVVILLFLIAGVLPGRLFSHIPVTHVFRRYTDKKQNWKNILLFLQFAGVTFVFGLLCVVMLQYNYMLDADLGYNPERIATAYKRFENRELAKNTIGNLPMVENISFTGSNIIYGFSGEGVEDDLGNYLFSTRTNYCDLDYPSLMGIPIIEGRNIMAVDEIIVNEEFVKLSRFTESPIGKIAGGTRNYGTIVGVMKNFRQTSLSDENLPMLFKGVNENWLGWVTVKVKEPFRENLMALNATMKEIYPTDDIIFHSLENQMEEMYGSVKRFRDIVIWSFVSILLITLAGLIGYTGDEIQRRSKEVAIRKVNGAGVVNILELFSRQVLWLALPAVLIGAVISYFISHKYLDGINGVRISLGVPLFILVLIFVLFIILSSVWVTSWRIANDNPVKSIVNE